MFRRRGSWSSRSRGGSSWSRSRQRDRPWFRPLPLLIGVISLLIIIELGLRAIAGFGWLGENFQSYRGEPQAITAYRLQFVDRDRRPYDGLPAHGDLLATYQPLLGYDLIADQSNPFWSINAQGFRDDDPVPLAKPAGEIRVFVMGGSAAFGQLSESNQATFAHLLEEKLNNRIALQTTQADQFQPEVLPFRLDQVEAALARQARIPNGQYRVINAAVPGYASGNELAHLTQEILAYRPNLMIVLDGYEDLRLSSEVMAAGVPQLDTFLADAGAHLKGDLAQQFDVWINRIYVVKALRSLTRPKVGSPIAELVSWQTNEPLATQFTADEEELQQRMARYGRNLRAIAQITANARIPTIVALQPEITGRERLTAEEEVVLNLIGDEQYAQRVARGYEALAAIASQVRTEFPQTLRALNLYTLFAQEPQTAAAFQSSVHLTPIAHEQLAERLYRALIETLEIAPRPFGQ